MRIEELDISTKLYNQLKLHNINNIEDMREITEEDIIYRWRNIGRHCLEELIEQMKKYNINFKTN